MYVFVHMYYELANTVHVRTDSVYIVINKDMVFLLQATNCHKVSPYIIATWNHGGNTRVITAITSIRTRYKCNCCDNL